MSLQQRMSSLLSKSVTALVSTSLTLGVISVVTEARAQEVSGSQSFTCSNATLNGTYGYQESGFRGTKAPFTPFTAVRTTIFNGRGNFSGSGFLSQGGDVKQYTITGTYRANSDCTVTLTGNAVFPDGTQSEATNQFGVIVNRGTKILAIQTTPGRNQAIIYKRVR